MQAGDTTGTCAVCLWPAEDATVRCGNCGFLLGDSEQARDQAMRDWDLRAAFHASAGDEPRMDKLLDLIRGGRPSRAEASSAVQDLWWSPGEEYDECLAGVASLLSAMVAGDLETLMFVCLSARGLDILTAESNQHQVARLDRQIHHFDWLDLEPALPTNEAERHFLLAGGIGEGGRADPAALTEKIAGTLPDLRRLPGSSSRNVIVINGCPGWRTVEHIYDHTVMKYQPGVVLEYPLAASAYADTKSLVVHLVRQAPVGRRHELILIRPGSDGVLRLSPQTVFARGGKSVGAQGFDLYAPVGAAGPVNLALVVREPDEVPTKWHVVKAAATTLPRGRVTRMTVELNSMAEARFGGNADIQASTVGWLAMLEETSWQLSHREIDVVFAIELVDDGSEARLALELVQDTVSALCHEVWDPEMIRVGAIGYAQHSDFADGGGVVYSCPLGDPRLAAVPVNASRLFANQHDPAAALEEALTAAVEQAWRPEADRFLVTMGARPPYPTRGIGLAHPCPSGSDWKVPYRRLRKHGIRLVAVRRLPSAWAPPDVDPALRHRYREVWNALGSAGRITLPDATVETVMKTISASFVPAGMPFAYAPAESHGPSEPWRTK